MLIFGGRLGFAHLRGEFDRYLHLWPPEHNSFEATAYDYPFRRTSVLEDLGSKPSVNRSTREVNISVIQQYFTYIWARMLEELMVMVERVRIAVSG